MAKKIEDIEAEEARLEAAQEAYADNEEQVLNEKKKKRRERRKSELECIKAIMDHKDGRVFFWNLLTLCNPFSTPWVPGDDKATYINIGRQDVGLYIYNQIMTISPDEYLLMIEENK